MGPGWLQMARFMRLVVGASSARPPPAPAFLLLHSRGHDTASMFSRSRLSPLGLLAAMQEMQEMRFRSPGGEDPPGGGLGNPLQYSCLETPMDRGAWRAIVCGVAKSQTQLKPTERSRTLPPSIRRLTGFLSSRFLEENMGQVKSSLSRFDQP